MNFTRQKDLESYILKWQNFQRILKFYTAYFSLIQCLKYEKLLSEVDKSSFASLRKIPKWGGIFSKNVFFASLKTKSEKNDFCKVVDQYLSILIKLSKEAKRDFKEEIIQERIDYQKNYCVQQMKNKKTSMVLLKYFDEKWGNKYIKTVLFDF